MEVRWDVSLEGGLGGLEGMEDGEEEDGEEGLKLGLLWVHGGHLWF